MTTKEIESRKAQAAVKFDVALKIKDLLAEAKKNYKALGGDWDGDDMDCEISTLVFEE